MEGPDWDFRWARFLLVVFMDLAVMRDWTNASMSFVLGCCSAVVVVVVVVAAVAVDDSLSFLVVSSCAFFFVSLSASAGASFFLFSVSN